MPHESSTVRRSPLSAIVVGVAVDMVLLYVLLKAGVAAGTAGALSLPLAAVAMYVLGRRADAARGRPGWFALAIALTVFLRAGVLAWVERIPGCPVILTAAVAAVAAGVLMWAATAVEWGVEDDGDGKAPSWRHPITALLIYAVLLRLVYLGLPELIHEEAYYWNYSRHLALGYLDHPPMVAWIIRGFTTVLGHTELGVRAGAFFLWLVGAWFVFKLARRIYNAATGMCAVLLFAVLPFFFANGMTMTPDAPLTACWAGALYFFYRALIDEVPVAWLGAGIFTGLGMLSKYPMVLLGVAVLVFMLTDCGARRWFRRVSPWEAAGIALLLFSPVIVWNVQNDWISFAFQGSRRAEGSFEFDLPILLRAAAILLTPVGLAAAAVVPFSRKELSPAGNEDRGEVFARGFRLLMMSALLPLAVFVAFSLFRQTKINWTGPLWIGVLPFMARMMATPCLANAGRWREWLSPRTWRTTAVVVLLIFGAVLYDLVFGLWGLPHPQNRLGSTWPELAAEIQIVAEQVEQDTGVRPLVVGMDGDRLSSWLAFYRSRAMAGGTGKNTGAAALDTAGPNLFGSESHMYRLWFPSLQQYRDRPLILVGNKSNQLIVHSKRRRAGPIREITTEKNGRIAWHLYYRVLDRERRPTRDRK